MLSRYVQALLSMALSAIVLAGSIMPPGIRHGHRGGSDPSHQHSDLSAIPASHSHHDGRSSCSEQHHGCRNDSPPAKADMPGKYATHLHFEWFGIPWTLPDSGKPHKENQVADESQLVYIRSSEDLGVATQQNLRVEKFPLPVSQEPLYQDAVESRVALFVSPPDAMTLLCDRARHERSGVQLT
jgi:hypothetical protein